MSDGTTISSHFSPPIAISELVSAMVEAAENIIPPLAAKPELCATTASPLAVMKPTLIKSEFAAMVA